MCALILVIYLVRQSIYIISFFQDDIKEEVGPEKSNICNGEFNQISECNKCSLQQYPSESLCRNEM
jgi:hypothetical protein